MSNLRKQFEEETRKKVISEHEFTCDHCNSESPCDVWNDAYIFWLEKKSTNECNLPLDFIKWYSGMKSDKILVAFNRWEKEIKQKGL